MKKTEESNVADTIALCYIRNDFEEFNKNLITFLKTAEYKGEPLSKLDKISHGKKVLFARRTKKFYRENKNVIDTINKYSDIVSFIYNNYNLLVETTNIKFEKEELYNYILKHELDMIKILTLLNRLKELGIDDIEFNENLNFTNRVQKIHINNDSRLNSGIVYYDNIEIIPNYNAEEIEYVTTGSNYALTVYKSNNLSITKDNCITLNSLTFDANRLPKSISEQFIFNLILQEYQKIEKEKKELRNTVDLSKNIESLEQLIKKFLYTTEDLSKEEYKKDLLKIISIIQKTIPDLINISIKYEQEMIDNYNIITSQVIESQKQNDKIRIRKK